MNFPVITRPSLEATVKDAIADATTLERITGVIKEAMADITRSPSWQGVKETEEEAMGGLHDTARWAK